MPFILALLVKRFSSMSKWYDKEFIENLILLKERLKAKSKKKKKKKKKKNKSLLLFKI